MSEEVLKRIFEETIERFQQAKDLKSKDAVYNTFVEKMLNLPEDGVCGEIRLFFKTVEERENEMKVLASGIKSPDDAPEASDQIKLIDQLIARVGVYKFWFTREAPKNIPDEIVLAIVEMMNGGLKELQEAKAALQLMVGLAGLIDLLK
jgi:hypothetical protein